MAHAAVILVKLDPNSDFQHRHQILNEFIIPEIKALPGFQKATLMNDRAGTGTTVVVFDTEEHATAALIPLMPANGPPVISHTVQAIEVEI